MEPAECNHELNTEDKPHCQEMLYHHMFFYGHFGVLRVKSNDEIFIKQ